MKFITKFSIPIFRIGTWIHLDSLYYPFAFYMGSKGQKRATIFLFFIEFDFVWCAKDYWIKTEEIHNGETHKCFSKNKKYLPEKYLWITIPPQYINGELLFINKY